MKVFKNLINIWNREVLLMINKGIMNILKMIWYIVIVNLAIETDLSY